MASRRGDPDRSNPEVIDMRSRWIRTAALSAITLLGLGDMDYVPALGRIPLSPGRAQRDAHCVASDQAGRAFACDSHHGRVLVYD
ncbi:MAG: hypothetical protein KGL36_06690 [Gammaproteobacteria bacterium]|nr:hypothetical protein [Gammaproteobacteria bacterium]